MPRIVPQPAELGKVQKMYPDKQARQMLGLGNHKWQEEREKIPYIQIGNRRWRTEEALLDYQKQNTIKPQPAAAEPPYKPVPPQRIARAPEVEAKAEAAPTPTPKPVPKAARPRKRVPPRRAARKAEREPRVQP